MKKVLALLTITAAAFAATVSGSASANDQTGNCIFQRSSSATKTSSVSTTYAGLLTVSAGTTAANYHDVIFKVVRGTAYAQVRVYHDVAGNTVTATIETSSGNASGTLSGALGDYFQFGIAKNIGGTYDVTMYDGFGGSISKTAVNLGGDPTSALESITAAAKSPCIDLTNSVSLTTGSMSGASVSDGMSPFYIMTFNSTYFEETLL